MVIRSTLLSGLEKTSELLQRVAVRKISDVGEVHYLSYCFLNELLWLSPVNFFHSSPRILGLVKYLPVFGREAIVVTVSIGEDLEASFGSPNGFKSKHRVVDTERYQPKRDIGEQAYYRKAEDLFRAIRKVLGG